MQSTSVEVIRIAPNNYIHVLDTNKNTTSVIIGPRTYTKQDHEQITFGPRSMITIPPRHYVTIRNPVLREEDGSPVIDHWGQFKLRYGDLEIRLVDAFPDPFPLYPGEELVGGITPLEVVEKNTALKIRAIRPFHDEEADVDRVPGDEWLFVGPGTYVPRVETEVIDSIKAIIIQTGEALQLRATREFITPDGVERKAGEEWLVRKSGAYMPQVEEEVVNKLKATVLTDKIALYLRAARDFVDVYGIERKAGEEWLVTKDMATHHITDVDEEMVDRVHLTTLTNRQYCVVCDPIIKGVQKLGTRQMRKGETSFFLKPGETLEKGIQDVVVLHDDEALLLSATEDFEETGVTMIEDGLFTVDTEGKGSVRHRPGERWMVHGPCEYVPPIEVEILERRQAIPLDENEGIYVRNRTTGKVKAMIGKTYMLAPNEELWEKDLPMEVEELLARQSLGNAYLVPAHYGGDSPAESKTARDRTRVVAFRVPHNAACQVYDYARQRSRVIFGPDLIMLGPEEQFTIIRLSGDTPKRPNVISTLTLMLGPDFCKDVVTVETADHARLRLMVSYNWHFDVNPDGSNADAIFSVRDFIGDACKALASRVRGAVAQETFDDFHKRSSEIIRKAVFDTDSKGTIQEYTRFNANCLVISNVDVQSVEPEDASTRESLQKSVQLAIEITTKSQEARAHHEAKLKEEEAKGKLVNQQLRNQQAAERSRKELLELKAESAAVESQGQAKAEAAALAEAAKIKAQADVDQTHLRAKAAEIEHQSKMQQLREQHQEELSYMKSKNGLEVERAREMAQVEATKFKAMVDAIGAETLAEMARAGPEMQARLLQGLGLKGYLVTDGKSPINLFQTASGMVGGPSVGGGAGAPAHGGDQEWM